MIGQIPRHKLRKILSQKYRSSFLKYHLKCMLAAAYPLAISIFWASAYEYMLWFGVLLCVIRKQPRMRLLCKTMQL